MDMSYRKGFSIWSPIMVIPEIVDEYTAEWIWVV
jgi:hypothetical protein